MRERMPLIVALTALVVAVVASTPIGEAAQRLIVPANSVGTIQLRNAAVTSAKVKDHSLLRSDFRLGQIPAGPTGLQGEAGPSDAFATAKDEPTPIAVGQTAGQIAELSIPLAGRYVIQAKAYFTSTGIGQLNCRLDTRQGDIDEIQLLAGSATPATLLLTHDYLDPGVVALSCSSRAAADAHSIRIVAIRVGSLTTSVN